MLIQRLQLRSVRRIIEAELRPGAGFTLITGANGSGKTSLLLTLAGLRAPATGEVLLDGTPLLLVARRHRAQQLGVLFQDTDTAFPCTVRELVLTGRHPHLCRWQHESASDEARVDAALASVGLEEFAARQLDTLSGGEQRRAAFAALLCQDSSICLFDEPANHLDPHHQLALLSLATARAARPGHLDLFVLHDVNLALRFCTHALLLRRDGTHAHGTVQDMLTPAHLEAVYGCAMRELTDGHRKFFFPA